MKEHFIPAKEIAEFRIPSPVYEVQTPLGWDVVRANHYSNSIDGNRVSLKTANGTKVDVGAYDHILVRES